MYENGTKAYSAAISGGALAGVRTTCTASTSKAVNSCVGNTPYNVSCQPKCLNVEWNTVQILDAAGAWKTSSDQDSVTVTAGLPVRAKLAVGKIAYARVCWQCRRFGSIWVQ